MESVKRFDLLLQQLPRGLACLWSEKPVLNGSSLLVDFGNLVLASVPMDELIFHHRLRLTDYNLELVIGLFEFVDSLVVLSESY